MKIKLSAVAVAIAMMSPLAVSAQPTSDSQTIKQLQCEVHSLHNQVNQIKATEKKQGTQIITVENKEVHRINIPSAFYFGSTPILSAPYIGTQTMFDGSHLIVNIPSTNEDLRLLQLQQKLYNTYFEGGIPAPSNPYVQFSGKIEGAANVSTPYVGDRTSDINLVGAELDMAAVLNPWAVSFLGFTYDSAPPSATNPPITRVLNSSVDLSKGFLSIGNFNKSPVYGTIGQFVMPFGLYASNMLTPTLTSSLGQMLERAVLVGYSCGSKGPYGSIFTFKGDSGTGGTLGHINQMGLNVGFKKDFGEVKTDVGGGYIANIADSLGMQTNGQTSGFTGFGGSSTTELLRHRVPAVDVRGNVAFGKYDFKAEYIDSVRAFDPYDLSFNGSGARPSALDVQGSYSFLTFSHPSAVALGYDNSTESLALLIPKQRYSASYNMAIWRHTIGTIEYHHDINYTSGNSAAGGGNVPVVTTVGGTNTSDTLGHTSDTLTVQLGVYY